MFNIVFNGGFNFLYVVQEYTNPDSNEFEIIISPSNRGQEHFLYDGK